MKAISKKLLVTLSFLASTFVITSFASAGSINQFGGFGGWGGYGNNNSNAVSYAQAGPGGATAYSSTDTGGYSPFGGSNQATSYAQAGPGGATAYSNTQTSGGGFGGYGGWGGWGNNNNCHNNCRPQPPVVQPQPCGFNWNNWRR